jgi:hypothetical protein
MPSRTRPPAPNGTPAPAAVLPVLDVRPDGIYLPDQLRQALKLRASSIRREVREGRLRVAKRCGRYYVLGAWLLEWVAAGELRPRVPEAIARKGGPGETNNALPPCPDLQALCDGRYRLSRDPTASPGDNDPWLQVLVGRYGEIYPYG